MSFNRVEARRYALVLFGLKDPTDRELDIIMSLEDPIGFAIEMKLPKDEYDLSFPPNWPGDDVSEEDLISHDYHERRDP